jgi:4-hydroxybenzoate polyprenyltransferase
MKIKSSLSPHALAPYIELLRPYIALPPLLAFLIGERAINQPDNRSTFIMAALVLLLVVVAATVYNDIEDREIDRDNRLPRHLFSTYTSVDKATIAAAGMYAIAAVLAVRSGNQYIIVFVSAGLLLSWAYNSAPLRLSRRPLSSILTLGVSYGALPIMLGGHSTTIFMYELAFSWFLQRCGISILKDYKDVTGDAKHQKRTFLLTYGAKATAITSLLLGASGGMAGLVLLHNKLAFGPISAPIMTLLLSIGLFGLLLYRATLLRSDIKQCARLFGKILEYQNLYDGILLICLIQS